MRKYSEVLFGKMINGSKHFKRGNHSFEKVGNVNYFTYHTTDIITINDDTKTIVIKNGGWDTSSTSQAIRSHLEAISKYLNVNEYTLIDATNGEKYKKDAIKILGI